MLDHRGACASASPQLLLAAPRRQTDARLTDQQLADLIIRERSYKVFDGKSLFSLSLPAGSAPGAGATTSVREKVLLLGSHSTNYLIDLDAGIMAGVAVTPAHRTEGVDATIERVERKRDRASHPRVGEAPPTSPVR